MDETEVKMWGTLRSNMWGTPRSNLGYTDVKHVADTQGEHVVNIEVKHVAETKVKQEVKYMEDTEFILSQIKKEHLKIGVYANIHNLLFALNIWPNFELKYVTVIRFEVSWKSV